jgi:hypothetical protein
MSARLRWNPSWPRSVMKMAPPLLWPASSRTNPRPCLGDRAGGRLPPVHLQVVVLIPLIRGDEVLEDGEAASSPAKRSDRVGAKRFSIRHHPSRQ